ncbi:MAG TPA: hypothetical protein VKB31_01335 [Trueperaceae bacterium]|nr:hypothetical protein [Trueperaceae bacterium]
MSCALEVDGDGTPEYSFDDCSTASDPLGQTYAYAAAGTYTARLTLTDNTHAGSWSRSVNVTVFDPITAVSVDRGANHALVARSDGTVWAWGNNTFGQLGDGTTDSNWIPRQVPGISDATAVTASGNASYALLSDGSLLAWGYNGNGELGDRTTLVRHEPAAIGDLSDVTQLASGHYAVEADGSVWHWSSSTTPSPVTSLAGIRKIAVGNSLALALDQAGTVWAWGANDDGQLGDGTTDDSAVPVRFRDLADVRSVDISWQGYGIALQRSAGVWTWENGSARPVIVHP